MSNPWPAALSVTLAVLGATGVVATNNSRSLSVADRSELGRSSVAPVPSRAPAVAARQQTPRSVVGPVPAQAFLDTYCITCHNQRLKTAGLMLDTLDLGDVGPHAAEWEKVVVKLRAGLMPPQGIRRPQQAVIDEFASSLEFALDRAAAANPNPGRTETFHRLNRAEYRNAVRDLLGVDIDVTRMLPADEISYGFDNIAGVLKLSPLLTERYLLAAQKVARLALGTPAPPNGDTFKIPDELNQDVRLDGMPLGTRGGTRVDYLAPRSGTYVVKAKVGRGVDYDVPHFLGDQQLEISVDGTPVQVFTLPATPGVHLNPERQVYQVDANGARIMGNASEAALRDATQTARDFDNGWEVRVSLEAGVHEIRATFLAKTGALSEGFRRPYLKPYIGTGDTDQRETREGASLRELEILGPVDPGSAESSPGYRRVFTCRPTRPEEELPCATQINSTFDADRNGFTDNEYLAPGTYSGTGRNALTVDYKGGRNGARGPAYASLDLRMGYRLSMQRERTLDLFLDVFNITDRVNLANPAGDQRVTGTFLVPTNIIGATRTAQLNVRYGF